MIPLSASVGPLLARFVAGVGKERVFPPLQGSSQAGDLGDRASEEDLEDLGRDLLALGWVVGLVGGAQVVDRLPGNEHFLVGGVGLDHPADSSPVPIVKTLHPGT